METCRLFNSPKPTKKDADVEKSSWDKRPRQHRRQEQAQSSPDPGCGAPLSSNQSYGGASFDRPRFPDVQAEMSVASPVGFRCSVVQSGVAQPTKNGIADGTTGGWGGGQFQAVPASSLQWWEMMDEEGRLAAAAYVECQNPVVFVLVELILYSSCLGGGGKGKEGRKNVRLCV